LIPAGSYANTQFIRPWGDEISQESANKLTSRICPSMQLGGTPPHRFEQVYDGVAGVIGTLPGYTAGRFPPNEVFELPFTMQNQDAEATGKALRDDIQQHDAAEFKDVHPIAFQDHGPGVFHIATSRSRRSATRRARALPSRSSKARLSIAQLVCQSRREGIDLSRRQVPMRVLRVRPPRRTPD
jgi:TRAP-type C4-dicarboxylate transport system substrate-binding protein